MIISHRFEFIFIKNLKTAGTSIETVLSPLCGPCDVLTEFGVPEPGHRPRNHRTLFRRELKYYNHMSASEIRERLGRRRFDRYFKFCVERHPIDKCLSHFSMFLNSDHHRPGEVRTLDDYMRRGKFPQDWPRYTIDDELAVDRVLHYEHLEDELREVLGKRGCEWPGFGATRAKGQWRSTQHSTSDFTEEHRAILRREFAKPAALMGYEI